MYWSIEYTKSAWDYRNIKVLKYINYISSLIFVWSFDNEYIVDSMNIYTYQTVSRLFDNYSKAETLFGGYWSFCWLIVGDLENGRQAAAEHVGWFFEVS